MNLTLHDGQLALTLIIQGIVAVLFVGGLWFAINRFTAFDDHYEIRTKKNWVYLTQRYGMLIAAVIGIGGSFNTSGRWSSIGMMTLGAAWVTLVLLSLYPFIERMLSRTSNPHEAYLDDMPVSVSKAAAYVTVGMVLLGALSGSSPDGTTAIAATIAFTVMGLAVVPFALFVHFRGLTRMRVRALNQQETATSEKPKSILMEAREGNRRAAFELSGVLVALGILLRNAIAGDFIGWWQGIVSFVIAFGMSLVLLYVYRVIVDKLIFRKVSVDEAQAVDMEGPAVLLALLLPITAYIVSKVVTPIAGVLFA
jgi:hypothetical protein